MEKELFEVEKDRFDLKDSSVYRLQGIWQKGYLTFIAPKSVMEEMKRIFGEVPASLLMIWALAIKAF